MPRLLYAYSPEVHARLWVLYRRGETLRFIGKELGVPSGCVHRIVAKTGGITPPPKTRAEHCLSLAEREQISRGLAAGMSLRAIARELDRPASTVSREVKRNGGVAKYRAVEADERAWEAALRPKECRLILEPELCRLVVEKLELTWSPQQISSWLKLEFPGNEALQVSHETIYRTLFIQSRGALRLELAKKLRKPRSVRKPPSANANNHNRGQIVDAVSISERPPEAADRAIPGHWEGDLLAGARNSHVATLVERRSRFVQLVKVDGKDTNTVVSALIRHVQNLPGVLYQSLTWDRGTEMANHKQFTIATDIKVYFCDPKSPWQRGSNENTNGLLRQFLPDGTNLKEVSQEQLDHIAWLLNGRPRKTLGFRTPAQKLAETVAMTG